MFILWKNHPTDNTKNGKKEHVARELGTVAVGYGQAERCPRPAYGTSEWLEERRMVDANRPAMAGDAVVGVQGIEWGCQDRGLYPQSRVLVIKKVGAETVFYDGPPADCPESIRRRYQELVGTPVNSETEAEAIRVREAELKKSSAGAERARPQGRSYNSLHREIEPNTFTDIVGEPFYGKRNKNHCRKSADRARQAVRVGRHRMSLQHFVASGSHKWISRNCETRCVYPSSRRPENRLCLHRQSQHREFVRQNIIGDPDAATGR